MSKFRVNSLSTVYHCDIRDLPTLRVQPDGRPTAARALRHGWLVGLKSNNEDSGEEQDGVTQSQGESRKSRDDYLLMMDKRKDIAKETLYQDDTRCIPRDVAAGANMGPPRS